MKRIILEHTDLPIAAGDWLHADVEGISNFMAASAERAAVAASLGITQQQILLLRSLRRLDAAHRRLRKSLLAAIAFALPQEIGELQLALRYRPEIITSARALRFTLGMGEASELLRRLPRRMVTELLVVDADD